MNPKIPIEISARHIHLSRKDLEKLFGKNHKLKKKKDLTQPGQFAAQETLTIRVSESERRTKMKTKFSSPIQNRKKKIKNVRIVGPLRKKTQVEIAWTDAVNLSIKVPIRKSGNLAKTPGIDLMGPKGKLRLKEGIIIPWRHIHLNPGEAKRLKVKNGDLVSVRIKGKRAVTFHNVLIRVDKNYKPSFHLDTDEGNAAGIMKKGQGKLIL